MACITILGLANCRNLISPNIDDTGCGKWQLACWWLAQSIAESKYSLTELLAWLWTLSRIVCVFSYWVVCFYIKTHLVTGIVNWLAMAMSLWRWWNKQKWRVGRSYYRICMILSDRMVRYCINGNKSGKTGCYWVLKGFLSWWCHQDRS